ncbi:MAG: hypothetical protein J5796_04460 [Erysipelotrichaceae bacterium]|nr:hypothetical protein [Erysipelotrichaceae bacterium]
MKTAKKAFLTVESVIYVLFILMDLKGLDSTYVKYAGMVFCFLYCLMGKYNYMKAAMFFTLLADFFLLVLNDHYLIGVSSFIVVQMVYCLYLYTRSCSTYLPVRAVIYAVLLVAMYLKGELDLFNAAVLFYFMNLTMNFISSLSGDVSGLYSIGLFLFVLCDICVGLHNLLPAGKPYDIATFLMWVFYLPSQVLISIHDDK